MTLSEFTYGRGQESPRLLLTLCFMAWKLMLLAIALFSPGQGYDTSTALLDPNTANCTLNSGLRRIINDASNKLVRWDAIYFTQIAKRGYTFEQEWAFGWGFTRLLSTLRPVNEESCDSSTNTIAIAGIFLAHGSHLLSVLMLYQLTILIWPTVSKEKLSTFALLSAILHIISPAGLFLSAPYAESPFSLLSFIGFYLYAKSHKIRLRNQTGRGNSVLMLSGLVFGFASMFRGNGLFSGLIFIYDAIEAVFLVLHGTELAGNIRIFVTIVSAGLLMACIAIVPQYFAYVDLCTGKDDQSSPRPWCSNWIPSVYAWVQGHYWGVGFLKYWSFSNSPLFLVATPMLCILLCSGVWAWTANMPSVASQQIYTALLKDDIPLKRTNNAEARITSSAILHRLAVPQIVLAALTLTTYHVQIVTRLSSGYPLWYWWLASMVLEDCEVNLLGLKWRPAKYTIRWMIMYAIIQGGLFASFLPPA